jgi:hypothetical protein
LLVHNDVNLFPAHERDHGSPLGDPVGDIVPRHSHRVIEVDINDFMLRISALNPGCHCCLRNKSESDAFARICRIEFSVHTAAAPREIVQRFERGARAGVDMAIRTPKKAKRKYSIGYHPCLHFFPAGSADGPHHALRLIASFCLDSLWAKSQN